MLKDEVNRRLLLWGACLLTSSPLTIVTAVLVGFDLRASLVYIACVWVTTIIVYEVTWYYRIPQKLGIIK